MSIVSYNNQWLYDCWVSA